VHNRLPWKLFDCKSQFFKGLFIPKSAVEKYTRQVIRDLIEAETQYVETRHNFMAANTLKEDNGEIVKSEAASGSNSEPFLAIVKKALDEAHDEIKATKKGKMFDLKVIYTTPRSLGGDWEATKKAVEWAFQDVIEMKRLFSDIVCGSLYPNGQASSESLPFIIPQSRERRLIQKQYTNPPF
jgi:hypothetical protein